MPEILGKSTDWFASQGRNGAQGLRSYSVSGRLKEPGIKLVAAGTTARELFEDHCGGVGCQTRVHVREGQILYIDGRDGPANNNRLCVKGRFGFDYITHRDRLTKPLIRRDDAPFTRHVGAWVEPSGILRLNGLERPSKRLKIAT